MILNNYSDESNYRLVNPNSRDNCIIVTPQKLDDSPFCPVCPSHERRMILKGKYWNCIECGRSFPVADIQKEDLEADEEKLFKMMRSKTR
jgi:tRNA(Ile2) C34 agmatinyltransferase TiaS